MEKIMNDCEKKVQELMEMLREKEQTISELKDEMRRKEIQCHRLAHPGADF